MKILDLNVPLINLEGEKDEQQTLGRVLATVLGQETEGKTLKIFGWWQTLLTGEPLQLDDSDIADLRILVDTNKRLFIYVKGQILEIINKL